MIILVAFTKISSTEQTRFHNKSVRPAAGDFVIELIQVPLIVSDYLPYQALYKFSVIIQNRHIRSLRLITYHHPGSGKHDRIGKHWVVIFMNFKAVEGCLRQRISVLRPYNS